MRTFLDRWYGAAAAGLAIGLVLGFCVATAMGRDLYLYMRFVGVLLIAAIVAVGAWVYRTYVHPPAPPVVEEIEAGTAS